MSVILLGVSPIQHTPGYLLHPACIEEFEFTCLRQFHKITVKKRLPFLLRCRFRLHLGNGEESGINIFDDFS